MIKSQAQFKSKQLYEKGKWEQNKNLNKVRCLRDWQLEGLEIYETDRQLLLSDILHISFQDLFVLRICNVKLASIEPVGQLHCPQLDTFSLANSIEISEDHNNHVVFIKELRKVYWKKLTRLALYSNHIKDPQWLSQCSFQKLKFLFIDFYPLPESHMDNTTAFFKLLNSELQMFQIHGDRPNILQMTDYFQHKWTNTTLRMEA